MSTVKAPPLYEPVVDENRTAMPAWTLFFNNLFTGDTGAAWTPTFVSLGSTGTPTITGRYYQLSKSLVYFRVTITPATDTSSVAGTTYISNFPQIMRGDGMCASVVPAAGVGGSLGVCVSSLNRIYTPVWTTVTNPVIIVGIVEAQ